MIRSELCALVGGKINMTDAATLVKLGAWAERRHDMLCQGQLWKDLLSIYTLSVTANQTEVILPQQIDRHVAAKYDQTNLMPVDQVFLFATDPGIWDRVGTALRVAELPSVGTAVKPAGEIVTFVSSNAADTTQKISIVGELAGVEVRETLMLNGTTVVNSANQYDLLYTVAKQQTVGTVTVKGFTSGTTLETLLADENERKHVRLRLLEAPVAALTLMVLGKRRVPPFKQDSDACAVRKLDLTLEAFVHADAYENLLRQTEDAADKRQEAMALLAELVETEVFQAANIQQLVPYDSHDNAGPLYGKTFL